MVGGSEEGAFIGHHHLVDPHLCDCRVFAAIAVSLGPTVVQIGSGAVSDSIRQRSLTASTPCTRRWSWNVLGIPATHSPSSAVEGMTKRRAGERRRCLVRGGEYPGSSAPHYFRSCSWLYPITRLIGYDQGPEAMPRLSSEMLLATRAWGAQIHPEFQGSALVTLGVPLGDVAT